MECELSINPHLNKNGLERRYSMEHYRKLFEIYLRICRKKYDPEKPYDNLEECCKWCDNYEMMLRGMLNLLEAMGEITSEQNEVEFQNLIDTFSNHKLFNASIMDGEVYVWEKVK